LLAAESLCEKKRRYDSIVQHAMVILVPNKRVFARASIYVVVI
jgi:hypothetical protein